MIIVAATPGRGDPFGGYSGYAVMAIERKGGIAYPSRVGLGEIDQDAWWKAEAH
jgi:hypothetical protein